MILKSLTYTQNIGAEREWRLDELSLGGINLIVGRNASGKSRTLNVINGLAGLVSGRLKPFLSPASYDAVFDYNGQRVRYILCYEKNEVTREELWIGKQKYLSRKVGGMGSIVFAGKNDKIKERKPYQSPTDQIAVVARQDSIQHDFLSPLFNWGASVFFYQFGSKLGQDRVTNAKFDAQRKMDLTDSSQVAEIFRRGIEKHKSKYMKLLKSDMDNLDYAISNIELLSANIKSNLPFSQEDMQVLYVNEKDLPGVTSQFEISQGMFRALSLLIQVNYVMLSKMPCSILIDDIGEGLDYERSTNIIRLLIEKAKKSGFQLLMSTNDRFVMNQIPLDVWTILERQGPVTKVHNYKNSKRRFEAFEYTGLSNFDFFSSEFVSENE
ncbi:MAG: ATP-binding protein [SAR324 cluster bacterium]|nr:ATP-binding protein [SAR324 cluster bacterium]